MFKLEMETDNAAFEGGHFHLEIARILREVAKDLEMGLVNGRYNDVNGNTVCETDLTDGTEGQ